MIAIRVSISTRQDSTRIMSRQSALEHSEPHQVDHASESDDPIDVNDAPPVDTDHPAADRYLSAIAQLEAIDNDVFLKALARLWRMLDNTKFMTRVYQWLSVPTNAARVYLAKYYPRWLGKGWYRLLTAAGAVVTAEIAIPAICQAIRDRDLRGARLALTITMNQMSLQMLAKVAIKEGSEQIALWFIGAFPMEEARVVIGRTAHRQSSPVVWQAAMEIDPRPFGAKGQKGEIHPALITYAIEHKYIAPSDIAVIITHAPVPKRELWTDREQLGIVAQHQSDLITQIVYYFSEHGANTIQFMIELLEDVHAGDQFLLRSLLRIAEECDGDYCRGLNIEDVLEILAWFISKYRVDLFSIGAEYFLTTEHEEMETMFQDCTREQASQYCKGETMSCIVSQTPLVSSGCTEYRVDHIYLYTQTMYLDAQAGSFVEGQWWENVVERLNYASMTSMQTSESSSEEDPSDEEYGPPKRYRSSVDEDDQPDYDSPKVNAWSTHYPDQVVEIHLPRFLIPVMQASAGRAKSARSAIAR